MKLSSVPHDSMLSTPSANSASVTLSISNAPGENFANAASNAVFQV